MRDKLLHCRLGFLSKNFRPKIIFDVGANDPFDKKSGALGFWKKFFPKSDFYLFEAAESFRPKLEKSELPYEICLLGSKRRAKRTFYQHKDDPESAGASCYLENSDFYTKGSILKKRLTTETLDDVVARRKWPAPNLIKIDTQGAELDVLRGASKCLAAADAVICEVKLQEYNRAAPFAFQVEEFLWMHNFRLLDILSLHYLNNWAIEADMLFVKRDHPLASIKKFSWKQERASRRSASSA